MFAPQAAFEKVLVYLSTAMQAPHSTHRASLSTQCGVQEPSVVVQVDELVHAEEVVLSRPRWNLRENLRCRVRTNRYDYKTTDATRLLRSCDDDVIRVTCTIHECM